MSWRLARSLDTLRGQVNTKYPHRDKGSDGTIGDARHQAESHSDHNPNAQGVVRAWDIDVDGIPAATIAENLRVLGARGDKRLNPGGYVILNRRIASDQRGWLWHSYTGTDPHTSHIHLSVSTQAGGYDLVSKWTGILPTGAPVVSARPVTHAGNAKPTQTVVNIQNALVKHGLLHSNQVDGMFGPITLNAVKHLQVAFRLRPTGVVDGPTWNALASQRLKG